MKLQIIAGDSPLLLAQPHGGMQIPEPILARLNSLGREKTDADWHITRLYADLVDDVSLVSMPMHRYVIDANRDPADVSLYPGQNTTSLCPTTSFDGESIYLSGQAPSADEIRERQQLYHQPYHDALAEQLQRIHDRHGYAILYDCHSIRSLAPYLFEGKLPDFNIGTNSGSSCAAEIENTVRSQCELANSYTTVSNGRFKGGWTTRHYGRPGQGYHAIQMELAQCNYMDEFAPWRYQPAIAQNLRKPLKHILQSLLNLEL